MRGLALMNTKLNSLNAVRILSPSDLVTLTPAQIPMNSQQPAVISTAIRPRICICCGEPLVERGNALSRNPNIAEEMNDYVWLKPKVVAEIKFAEWTTGGVLRHAEFVTLPQEGWMFSSQPRPANSGLHYLACIIPAHQVSAMNRTCIGIRTISGVAGLPRRVTLALAAWMLAGRIASMNKISPAAA
jgi:hypothetical protein